MFVIFMVRLKVLRVSFVAINIRTVTVCVYTPTFITTPSEINMANLSWTAAGCKNILNIFFTWLKISRSLRVYETRSNSEWQGICYIYSCVPCHNDTISKYNKYRVFLYIAITSFIEIKRLIVYKLL